MGVVTDARGRLLLVRGDRRGWEPPGGQVELGEDLAVALKREVREESGCEIEVGRLVGVYSNLGRPEEGVAEQINFAFSCAWVGGEPRVGDECLDAGWFSEDEALRLVQAPTRPASCGTPSRPARGGLPILQDLPVRGSLRDGVLTKARRISEEKSRQSSPIPATAGGASPETRRPLHGDSFYLVPDGRTTF
jgi:ADP-ribose pyrophosphatase YjhB (NUDIX family)